MTSNTDISDEIDLSKILYKLQQSKRFILIGILVSALIALIVFFVLPKEYVSQATIQIGANLEFNLDSKQLKRDDIHGIRIPQYKSYENAFKSSEKINLFLKEKGIDGKVSEKEFDDYITVIYSYNKNMNVQSQDNTIIGLKIVSRATDPRKAFNKTLFIGQYIKTTVLNYKIWKLYNDMQHYYTKMKSMSEKEILITNKSVENTEKKVVLIEKDLLKLNSSETQRQIVEVDEKTEKYLSPQQQLISAKVSIQNYQVEIETLENQLKVSTQILNFLKILKSKYFTDNAFWIKENLWENIQLEKEKFINSLDNSYISLNVKNQVSEEFIDIKDFNDNKFLFITKPSLPESPDYTKNILIAAGILISLSILIIFIALIKNN